jgi:hypothetical protein
MPVKNADLTQSERDEPPVHYAGLEEMLTRQTLCGRPKAGAYDLSLWENESSNWKRVTCLDCLKLRPN